MPINLSHVNHPPKKSILKKMFSKTEQKKLDEENGRVLCHVDEEDSGSDACLLASTLPVDTGHGTSFSARPKPQLVGP